VGLIFFYRRDEKYKYSFWNKLKGFFRFDNYSPGVERDILWFLNLQFVDAAYLFKNDNESLSPVTDYFASLLSWNRFVRFADKVIWESSFRWTITLVVYSLNFAISLWNNIYQIFIQPFCYKNGDNESDWNRMLGAIFYFQESADGRWNRFKQILRFDQYEEGLFYSVLWVWNLQFLRRLPFITDKSPIMKQIIEIFFDDSERPDESAEESEESSLVSFFQWPVHAVVIAAIVYGLANIYC